MLSVGIRKTHWHFYDTKLDSGLRWNDSVCAKSLVILVKSLMYLRRSFDQKTIKTAPQV
jgi:hypothetical protein